MQCRAPSVHCLLEARCPARLELEEATVVVRGRVVPQLLLAEDELHSGEGRLEGGLTGGRKMGVRAQGHRAGKGCGLLSGALLAMREDGVERVGQHA